MYYGGDEAILNSNDGTALGLIGGYTLLAGEWKRGVALMEKAKILNPNFPDYYHFFLSAFDFHNGDYIEALKKLQQISFMEWPPIILFLISASTLTDNMEEAKRYHDALINFHGDITLEDAKEYLVKMIPYADDLVETIMAGLRSIMTDRATSP